MVSKKDLKEIALFQDLTDPMLERLVPMTRTESLDERQIIYEEGTAAKELYCLKRGKVLLEAELAPGVIISLSAIKPGYSFGWASFFPAATHGSYAVCGEPSDILAISGKEFVALLDADPKMGYLVMQKSAKILENRLEHRTQQFLKVITKHPEIGALLGL
jgi:CRP-like cAMP-binding protein